MATKKITQLTELTTAASGDVLPIVDIAEDITKKIQVSNFPISTDTQTALDAKQDNLVSGTNIKTINSESLLGSGDISISANPSGGAGLIQFSDGSAFASDSNLFWNNTNKRLGIGEGTPTARMHIKGSGSTSATISLLVQNSSGMEVLKVTDDSATNARGNLYVLHPSFATRSLRLEWGSIFATDSGSELLLGAVFAVSSSPQILLAGNTRSSGANTMQLQASSGVSIASSLTNPNASAILDVSSTTKGFLPPRMTTTQKNAISSPASGLMVYDTDTNKLCCYNGTSWNDLF
jgi:hypothetical protein